MVARAHSPVVLGQNSGLQAKAERESRIEHRMSSLSLASPWAVLVLRDLGNQNLGINPGRAALSHGKQPALQIRTPRAQ